MRRLRSSEIEGVPGEPRPPLVASVVGRGAPCLLVPGFGLGPTTYRRTADLLAARRARVVVPRWVTTAPPWTYHGTLSAIAATLDQQRIGAATVIGHSFGGALALGFAARYPDRVERLVLVDSNGLEGHWELAREALPGFLRAYRLASLGAAVDFFSAWTRHGDAMVRAAWWGFNCSKADEIARVRSAGVPRSVLWAERDTLLSQHLGERFAADLGTDLVVVDDPGGHGPVDHSWPFRNPKLFVDKLVELGLFPAQRATPVRRAAN